MKGRELLGNISEQSELDYLKEGLEFYPWDGIIIGNTAKGIDLPSGQHVHSGYEFLYPVSTSFISRVDNREVRVEKNKIFPINSEQPHGPRDGLSKFRFLCLEVKKAYMQDIANSIFSRPDIYFANESFELDSELHILIRMFMDECKNRQLGYQFMLQGLQSQIAVCLLRRIRNNLYFREDRCRYHENKGVRKIIEFFYECYDKEFSLDELAKLINLSPYHFIRSFKKYTGKTPFEYLTDIRIQKTRAMLSDTNKSVTEICFECGFNNLSHFTALFRKKVGVAPSEYRKLLKIT